MQEQFVPCENIINLYNTCFEKKQCHHDDDKIIYYKDIKLKCYTIKQLYRVCNMN